MTVFHGGRLDAAIERFGGKREKWLDLSTGINAKPYPVPEIAKNIWQDLPQDKDLESLIAAAASMYGAVAGYHCSAAAGSQAHIQALPYLFKPQSVAIVGFTYQEHGMCWQRAGHDVLVADGLESAEVSARIIVVVNPNNPDGRTFDPEQLAGLARRLGTKGGVLVVDEAFGDVAPEISVMAYSGQAGLVVLRSFGKFFGLAGLRLGFAFGPRLLIERLRDYLGPWPVSGPAIRIGIEAFADKAWIRRSRKKLTTERKLLEKTLEDSGFATVGGTDLFVLASHVEAQKYHEHLAGSYILTRPFPGREDWLRFGVPGSKPAHNRLAKALAQFEPLKGAT